MYRQGEVSQTLLINTQSKNLASQNKKNNRIWICTLPFYASQICSGSLKKIFTSQGIIISSGRFGTQGTYSTVPQSLQWITS